MKKLFSLALLTSLAGCDQSVQSVSDIYDVQPQQEWELPDGQVAFKNGQHVDIGDEITYIIGTDQCSTQSGIYECWKYSLTSGDTQLVSLANGTRELWKTNAEKKLIRPNGVEVIIYEFAIFRSEYRKGKFTG